VALLAALAALQFGGGAAAEPIADPGDVVRFGLPLAKLVVNIGAAGTIGALALAAFAMSRDKPEFNLSLDIAAGSAAVWTVASAATGFFSFMTLYLQPISIDDRFGDLLATFLTQTEIGQSWLMTALIAAALTVLCFAVRNQTLVLFMAVGAVLGLIPMALQGHAGGTETHDAATSAIWLHIVFAAVWLGGLLTLVISARTLDNGRIVPLIARYSTLAIVSFVVVAASGYVSAEIRVGTLDNLLTPYGILVLVKVGALGALGVFGVVQRRYRSGACRPRGRASTSGGWSRPSSRLWGSRPASRRRSRARRPPSLRWPLRMSRARPPRSCSPALPCRRR
jgi:putative copper resistance protein D